MRTCASSRIRKSVYVIYIYIYIYVHTINRIVINVEYSINIGMSSRE